eukprot:EG_transcript_11139
MRTGPRAAKRGIPAAALQDQPGSSADDPGEESSGFASPKREREAGEADPFPDLQAIPVEKVLQRWYHWATKQWEKDMVTVRLMPKQFAEGGLRAAHFMTLLHNDGSEERCVAKRQKDGANQPEAYETEVVMQAACRYIAEAFNARKPAKLVDFVDCFLIQREDASWWTVETYLPGKYIKHNNNYGYVARHSRNTPQAFSHFSYEYTDGKMMVVDIQGVGDRYTDPQIHSTDGKAFGSGDMGLKGMEKFLKTHWCNSICTYLGLGFCGPKKFGLTLHSQPRRDGTAMPAGPCPEAQPIRISEYVGDVQPRRGGATPQDLALLGLAPDQFAALAAEFTALDRNRAGFLDKSKLYGMFQKARVCASQSREDEEFAAFSRRVERHVDAEGRISFKWFLLCWTDNQ